MIGALSLILALSSAPTSTEDPLRSAAATAIRQLVHNELWGHYDLQSVTVLTIADHPSDGGSTFQDYEVRRVTARFRAIRNEYWKSPNLNREVPGRLTDREKELYLLFRPKGYVFAGTLDVDLANTVDGWRILNRHHHALIAFPLAGYLHCQPDPQNPDPDLAVIQACFGGQ